MQTKSYIKEMADGTEIWCNRWIPDEDQEIKGVIQLHHGLSEHCMRYDRFGSILAENGYVLSAYDVRGNGHTGELAEKKGNGKMGAIARKNGSKIVLEDLHQMVLDLKKEYDGKKVFLIGHSFGSFVSQAFIENFASDIDGCVLIGSAGPRPALITFGKILTGFFRWLCGPFSKIKLLAAVSFAGYNKKVQNPVSDFDWLSRNKLNVEMYNMDKWCGEMLTTSFFNDMMKVLSYIHKPANMKKIPEELPVLILAGAEDPVGDWGKTVKKLYEIYIKNGMSKTQLKLYENDRHELLNEDDKETVENDILTWLNKQ